MKTIEEIENIINKIYFKLQNKNLPVHILNEYNFIIKN